MNLYCWFCGAFLRQLREEVARVYTRDEWCHDCKELHKSVRDPAALKLTILALKSLEKYVH